jgi:hypothetical protein
MYTTSLFLWAGVFWGCQLLCIKRHGFRPLQARCARPLLRCGLPATKVEGTLRARQPLGGVQVAAGAGVGTRSSISEKKGAPNHIPERNAQFNNQKNAIVPY